MRLLCVMKNGVVEAQSTPAPERNLRIRRGKETGANHVFARSNFDQNEKVTPAIVLGDTESSALLDRACHTRPGGEIIDVRYIGTLSDNQLCDRALEFDEFFERRRALSENLASFLHTLGVPRDPPLEARLDECLKQCGVPDRPR